MPEQTTVSRTETTEHYEETRPSLVSSILAIAGFILVIIIVIWGLIHLASLLSPWFSSKFASKPQSALHIQAPASVTSGEAFTVGWTNSSSAKGSYSFVYPCVGPLHFDTTIQGVQQSIPCGAAFGVSGTTLSLTPMLSGTASTSVPLTIVFQPASGTQSSASATVAITPGKAPAPVPVKKTIASTPVGPADLSVTILSAMVDQYGNGTIVFDIANNGSGSSGTYLFEVFLPTRTTYTYYSPLQASLAPGSHVTSTLHFTQATPGAVSIIADPSDSVNDSSRGNNYTATNMSAPYGYNPQQYQVQPQPYVY